jgi:hypothetical protein
MGIQDEALFEKAYEEINSAPVKVEGRGEYMLRVSNDRAKTPEFIERYGRPNGLYGGRVFWFDTNEQRTMFRQELEHWLETVTASPVDIEEENGPYVTTRLRTVVKLNYKGKEYEVMDNFDYAYPIEAAIYYWAEGNLSCDCNRRLWIEKYHPGTVPADEEACGDTIECTAFRIELID